MTVAEVGKVRGFTPEEFGLRNPESEEINLSGGRWDPKSDNFFDSKGNEIRCPKFEELLKLEKT